MTQTKRNHHPIERRQPRALERPNDALQAIARARQSLEMPVA